MKKHVIITAKSLDFLRFFLACKLLLPPVQNACTSDTFHWALVPESMQQNEKPLLKPPVMEQESKPPPPRPKMEIVKGKLTLPSQEMGLNLLKENTARSG